MDVDENGMPNSTGFNRNMVECKCVRSDRNLGKSEEFNINIVECKYGYNKNIIS